MKILVCASEVSPLAETGGLAEVVGSLPPELRRLGHDVRIVTPLHGSIDRDKWDLNLCVEVLGVPVGFEEQWCSVHETKLPGTDLPVYLIEHERYFGRTELYQHGGEDYQDNAERFAFFARACCQLCKALDFAPDVMHCHDWQTALIPIYLKTLEAGHPLLERSASVLTLHNVGYQGGFPKDQIVHSQLGWELFAIDGLEHYDKINYLKGGILHADKVSTVSPTYAQEIQMPQHGWSLDGVLRARSPDLVGILNGCDYREWDPSTDERLPSRFDSNDLSGKAVCKLQLQKTFGLPERPDVPIVAIVSRLAYQKGVDVLAAAIFGILDLDLQFILLGTGEVWAHFFYGGLLHCFPGKAGIHIGFDSQRAHQVYAGADLFLMPSRYEPCGLGQLAAMRYGTLPIVRSTGGLVDTVENYDSQTGEGTGFEFADLTPSAIAGTVKWAISIYEDHPDRFRTLILRAMQKRYSWSTAAQRYENLYQWALQSKRGY